MNDCCLKTMCRIIYTIIRNMEEWPADREQHIVTQCIVSLKYAYRMASGKEYPD